MRKFFLRGIMSAILLLAGLNRPGAGAAESLPAVDDILKHVSARADHEAENDVEFARHYYYERSKMTEMRNGKGDIKKHEEKKMTNNPVLILSVQPVPVVPPSPPGTIQAAPKEASVSETNSNVRGKAFEKKDFALDAEMFKRFQFTLLGRETNEGRVMLVLAFRPASTPPPEKSLKDRFINRAAGRLWVDEQDSVVAKADVHLTEQVNIVGGLLGAVSAFTYSFDRNRTDDGWWYTRVVDWHLTGRELFLKRLVDYHEERSEVGRTK